MRTETNNTFLNPERLEQVSTLAFVAGAMMVFQWSSQSLYLIGLILLAVGSTGTLAGQLIQKNYLARIVERMTVVGMMVGILGMLQSWNIWLYEKGFYILCISTLGFIIFSHISSPEP